MAGEQLQAGEAAAGTAGTTQAVAQPTHHAEGGVVEGGHQARVVGALNLHRPVRPRRRLV